MSNGDDAANTKSTWFKWIDDLKDAWKQAKYDYRQQSARKLRRQRQHQREASRATLNKPTAPTRVHGHGRSRDKPKDKSDDIHTGNDTSPIRHEPASEKDMKQVVDSNDAGHGPSILDASFLESIRRDVPEHDKVPRLSGNPVKRKRSEDVPSELSTRVDSTTVAEKGTTGDMPGEADQSTMQDDEYRLRVQSRMRQLEADLEAARVRLSRYEDENMAPPIAARIASTGIATPDMLSHPSSVASAVMEPGILETSAAEGVAIDVVDREAAATAGNEGDVFALQLSPSKLEFSPIRVEAADVSNGEIARREAVRALKQRITLKDKHG